MKTSLKLLFIASILVLSSFGNRTLKTKLKQEEKPITLAEYNLRVANKNKMVLVYFSADWCVVCLKMKPVIETISQRFSTGLEVLRIDTERDKEVTDDFEMDALPVLILYRNGVKEWIYIGIIDQTVLTKKIESYTTCK